MPKGPRKFHFSFEKTGLTRFGGLSLFSVILQIYDARFFLLPEGEGQDEGVL